MIPMAIRKISLVLIRSWTDCESSSNATKGKVLLDECIDSRLADHIHAVGGPYRRRSRMGGITNGKLLAMAQAEFDGFVPVDRNLSFQEHLTRDVRREPRREEKPGVRAISRAGALYRNGDTNRSAGVGEGGRVLLPRARIEVDSQKPTGFVFQERVGAHHVAALQVVDNDLLADRYEGLIHAVTAFASSLNQNGTDLSRSGIAALRSEERRVGK